MSNPKTVLHFAWSQPELFPREDEVEVMNDELVRYEQADVSEVL